MHVLVFCLVFLVHFALGQSTQRDALCALQAAFSEPALRNWQKRDCAGRLTDDQMRAQDWEGFVWDDIGGKSMVVNVNISKYVIYLSFYYYYFVLIQ